MFAAAVAKARQFTQPVVISTRKPDGSLSSMIGSFVVVNSAGWILTAWHIMDMYRILTEAKQAYLEHVATVADIESNKGLLGDQKKKKIKALGGAPKGSVTDFAFWWGADGCVPENPTYSVEADLALTRLRGFPADKIERHPIFKSPSGGIDPGTSICRLGFPFMQARQTYVDGGFRLDPSELAFFPNEGIFTREVINGSALLIETSSPGLKGQSGGPLFDKNGVVWGIQAHTGHLPLGFSPKIPGGKDGDVEHQFMNVGRGAHPKTICSLLRAMNVAFEESGY